MFDNLVYIDTGPLSVLVGRKDWWPGIRKYLLEHNLALAISDIVLAEISEANRKHAQLADLLLTTPSAFIKPVVEIWADEIRAYPLPRTGSLMIYGIQGLLFETTDPRTAILAAFDHFREARAENRKYAAVFAKNVVERKVNYMPGADGRYNKQQADHFAETLTLQWLLDNYPDFFLSFRDRLHEFHPDRFLAIRLFALTIFYKFYIQGRSVQPSDWGDMFHLAAAPYCKSIVVERDLCNILRQIQQHHTILTDTNVYNMDFLKIIGEGSVEN